jgi:hypothetical protein
MQTTLLNPYSVSLKKNPFMQVDNPVYANGDYRIYHYNYNHFVHTYKNIVICERGAANKDLLNDLIADKKPTSEAALYHDYDRPKAAIRYGIKAAKKLNFKIQ